MRSDFRHILAAAFAVAFLALGSGCVASGMTRDDAVAETENAKKLLAEGRPEDAFRLLAPVVDAFPTEPVPNILYQDAARQAGHAELILERYENLGTLLPQSGGAQLLYARILQYGEKRLKIARRAVDLEPDIREAREVLVDTIRALGILVEERKALNEAADHFGDNPVFTVLAARAASAAGDVQDALKRYSVVMALAPRVFIEEAVSDVARLGHRRFNQGDIKGARACFDFTISRGRTGNPDIRLALANCDVAEKKYKKARSIIESVLEDFGNHSAAIANLASLDAIAGKYESARIGYEKSLNINPNDYAARTNLANVLLKLNRPADAVREAAAARARNRRHAEVYPVLIKGYLELGMVVEAEFMFNEFLKRRPDAAKKDAGKYRKMIDEAREKIKDRRAGDRQQLEKQLEDPDPKKRASAFVKLNRLMRASGFPHLEKLLSSKHADIRARAAKNLGLLGDATRAAALLPLLDDAEEIVRREAVTALRAISGREFGYDPKKRADVQPEAVENWRKWCTEK